MSEWHYHFLSQSLHDLEHWVEQHQAEQHAMELNIMNFRHQIAWHFHFHPYGQTPSHIPLPTNHHDPPSNPSSHNRLCECHALVDISSTRTDKDQSHRQPLNDPPPSPSYKTADMRSRENPIYVFNDDDTYCKGCGEEGHFIGDCNREYRLMGGNTCQYLRGWTPWWNKHLLLIGTTTNKAIQDFKQMTESPQHSWITSDGSPMLIPSTCLHPHLSSTNASKSTPQWSIATPSLESLDNREGVVLQFSFIVPLQLSFSLWTFTCIALLFTHSLICSLVVYT